MVLPKGIVTSGFPRVRETCRTIGIEFDAWQVDLNRALLAKTADGLYAADTAAISIPRQVGKTFDVGAVCFAECIAVPGTTVVWTAHRFKVARETFNELRGLAKSPKLVPHLDYETITTAAGNECIPFRNGSRIVFAARERGAIRGFSKVRILVLDEAQILTEAALADLAPTMNQAENPLIVLMGTPPKPSDPSEVFTNLRTEALAGTSEGVLYVEMSADSDAATDDRKAWAKANASYPKRTPARAILRLRKLLSEDDFRREALGIWDDQGHGVLPINLWHTLRSDPPEVDPEAFGLDMTWDREWADLGWAVGGYVDLHRHARGSGWVVEECKALQARYPNAAVWTDPNGPAATLIEPLRDAGVRVEEITREDYRLACGGLHDAVTQGHLRHSGDPNLDAAVAGAVVTGGSGGWVWDRKRGAVISPLVAVTHARWGAVAHAAPRIRSLT